MLIACEIKVIRSLFARCHHVFQFGNFQVLVDGFYGFLNQFLTIIVNSIDIPMVDFLPQPLELILAGIVVQMIVDGFCRLVGILNHVCKSRRVKDTLY